MEQEYYSSKHFTAEQMDQRLLQGYYDDAVKAGYRGTKDEFVNQLAIITTALANNEIGSLIEDGELTPAQMSQLIVNDLTTGGADKALSAEMGKKLGFLSDNDAVNYLNAIISNTGSIHRGSDYTNKTFVTRYAVTPGMIISGHLDLIPFDNTSKWANLVLLDSSGNFSRVMTYPDFNNTGLTVNDNEKFLCINNPCKIGSHIITNIGGNTTTIRLDDAATLQSFRDLGDITSSQFVNGTYIFNNEASSLPEDRFIKSDIDYEVIEGAYIDTLGRIMYGNYGNIVVIKPKPSTQYIHIKGRLTGTGCTFLGYANTVDATNVNPILTAYTYNGGVVNADWYIKPVTYLYVFVARNQVTLESIDGFNKVQIPTVEQIADITSDVTSIFGTLPLQEEALPFSYANGYIYESGKVTIDNSFVNSLAVYDLEGLDRVKIKVKAVTTENFTTASFCNSNVPNSSSIFSPIIKTQSGVVTEIVIDVIDRYLFIYIGNNAQGAPELAVSKISILPTELVSKNELQEVENNITNSLTKKVDKKLGSNLFDKDSSDILYDTLLSAKNVTSQPSYASGFCVTPYIPIEEGKKYIANYSSGNDTINLCVVDATRSTVLLSINKTTGPEYKFTAPEGAAYVRMTLPMRLKDTFIFNEGEEVLVNAYYEDKPVYHSEFNPSNATPWKDKTIAMYGDSITELCGNDTVIPTSWGGYLISALYAKGVVRGWGGTPLHHSIWDNSTAGTNKRWFNSVGEKVAVGTEGAIQCDPVGMCDWKRIITQFPATIKDSIDAVILMGGTNGFRSTEIGDTEYIVRDVLPDVTTDIDVDWFNSEYYSGGDFDVTKIQGAVCSAILKLQTWMPNAVIIVATQLSGYWLTQGENGTHQLVSDKSGLTEGEFALKIAEAARYMSTPVIDINGLTGINQWNRTRYITDNVHPYTDNGKKAMARVFIGEMTRIRPNF